MDNGLSELCEQGRHGRCRYCGCWCHPVNRHMLVVWALVLVICLGAWGLVLAGALTLL